MVEWAVERLRRLCAAHGFRACKRLDDLLGGSARLPPDLLLQALIGVAEDVEREARERGFGEAAREAGELRVDLEWALREAVE